MRSAEETKVVIRQALYKFQNVCSSPVTTTHAQTILAYNYSGTPGILVNGFLAKDAAGVEIPAELVCVSQFACTKLRQACQRMAVRLICVTASFMVKRNID